jgi:type I restriction enzyme S subunit
MSLKTHDLYKESGIAWLGKVPVTWKVAAIKHGFDIKLGKMLQPDLKGEDDILAPYVRAANIQWKGVDASDVKQMWFSPQERAELALQENDLLVSEGGDVGRACLWRNELEECYFQNSVNRARSKPGNSPDFGRYWLSTLKDKGFIDVICNKSTIAHYTAEKLAATPALLPPHSEQLAIANFLDRETAKIDALIAEQQRLIELLQEKRQAVISHAVTKGLSPDVPLKDSGVECLGKVPEHWRIGKLKHICDVRDGTHETPSYVEPSVDSRPLVTSKDIGEKGISLEACSHISLNDHMQISRRSKVDKGDLLMPMIGSIGGCQLVGEDNEFSIKNVALFKPERATDSFWLKALINSDFIAVQFDLSSSGGVQSFVSLGALRNLTVPIISMSEQREIVDWLNTACVPLTDLLCMAESAVSLLRERRSALISAAVTGQIDVRGLVKAEGGEK